MSLTLDPEMRELEILRAIRDGAATYTDILPRSSYEHLSSLRRLCAALVQSGHLETWMHIKSRVQRNFSPWTRGPRAAHFRLATQGEERLVELEQWHASRNVETAAS